MKLLQCLSYGLDAVSLCFTLQWRWCPSGSTGEDSAPASDHTCHLLRQTASHTVSLRQVGIWIAANPVSDLHMSFSMQGKRGVKRVLYFAVLRN